MPNMEHICDTTNTQTVIDSLNRIVSEKVTLEALKNSQEFYNSAFDNIYSSFSLFLDKVNIAFVIIGIIIAVLTLIFAILTFLFQKEKKELRVSISNSEKDLKKEVQIQKEQVQDLFTRETSMFNKQFDVEKEKIGVFIKVLFAEEKNRILEIKEKMDFQNSFMPGMLESINKIKEKIEELETQIKDLKGENYA